MAEANFKFDASSDWDSVSLNGVQTVAQLKRAIQQLPNSKIAGCSLSDVTVKARKADADEDDDDGNDAVQLSGKDKLETILVRFGIDASPTVESAFAENIELFVTVPAPPALVNAEDRGKKRKTPPSVTPPEKRRRNAESTMVVNGSPKFFQSASQSFQDLLLKENQVYYDRTRYILELETLGECLLFCRPRRFGKTLTIGMLEHFHGIQFENERGLYKDLDIQQHIINKQCTPGQYFVLVLDFSMIRASNDLSKAAVNFGNFVNDSIIMFYETYAGYIEQKDVTQDFIASLRNCLWSVRKAIANDEELKNAGVRGLYLLVDEYDSFVNDYLRPFSAEDEPPFENTELAYAYKSFWTTIKSLRFNRMIQRIFITGISPLSLSYVGSAFNITKNVSFRKEVATICGLTNSELVDSLMGIRKSSAECETILSEMKLFFNGYHFCMNHKVETVFNTETCLEYLQDIADMTKPAVNNPQNSEISPSSLKMFATSAPVIADFQKALVGDGDGRFTSVVYDSDQFKLDFTLDDLVHNIDNSWRSLLVYFGGLTFDSGRPGELLRIPNKVAAKRIALAVLQNYKLDNSLQVALQNLTTMGDIGGVLGCYRNLMAHRDRMEDLTDKTEAHHRDSFYFCLQLQHLLIPKVEFKVTKRNRLGNRLDAYVDLIFETHGKLIITEWKFYRIQFLEVDCRASNNRRASNDDKAAVLRDYNLDQVLQIQFAAYDRYHTGTIEQQIMSEVPQLVEYLKSDEIKGMMKDDLELQAYLVIVVGSRHIILWKLDQSGELVSKCLAGAPIEVAIRS